MRITRGFTPGSPKARDEVGGVGSRALATASPPGNEKTSDLFPFLKDKGLNWGIRSYFWRLFLTIEPSLWLYHILPGKARRWKIHTPFHLGKSWTSARWRGSSVDS